MFNFYQVSKFGVFCKHFENTTISQNYTKTLLGVKKAAAYKSFQEFLLKMPFTQVYTRVLERRVPPSQMVKILPLHTGTEMAKNSGK